MIYLIYLIKIFTYFFICALIYIAGIKRNERLRFTIGGETLFGGNNSKISWSSIIFLSFLFGWYSTIVTAETLSADRKNYALRFTRNWEDPWTWGLNRIADFLHVYTNNENALFFTISFLCVFLVLFAYRVSRKARKETLLLLSCSQFYIFSFAGLKQAPANALGAVCLAFLFEGKYIWAVMMLAGAISFHESAVILVPILLLFIFSENKLLRILSYLIMTSMLLVFGAYSSVTALLLQKWIPDLYEQSVSYLGNNSISLTTAIKGFPFYLITAQGFIKRNKIKNQIENYDKYMVISFVCSITVLISAFSYWMSRFSYFCFFPTFSFAAELYKADENRVSASTFFYLEAASLALITTRYLFQIFFYYGGF